MNVISVCMVSKLKLCERLIVKVFAVGVLVIQNKSVAIRAPELVITWTRRVQATATSVKTMVGRSLISLLPSAVPVSNFPREMTLLTMAVVLNSIPM